MDQDSAHIVAASKVPTLKPGEFELWRIRIEQYIQVIDYALWESHREWCNLAKNTNGRKCYDSDAWNGYSKRKPKTTKPSTGWKRQSQSEAKVSQKSAT
ncbi:hypothetical protein Tco_0255983 [Tanacetum coccineum]